MAGADFDDAPRLEGPNHRVGGRRIEAGKPILVETGRIVTLVDGAQFRREPVDIRKDRVETLPGAFEQWGERRVIRSRSGMGITIRNEESACANPKQRRQAEPQPTPECPHGIDQINGDGGSGPSPSRPRHACASRDRSKSTTTINESANGISR